MFQPEFDEQGNIVLTVNGEKKAVPLADLEKMVAEGQKGLSANQRFEEAARLRREAEVERDAVRKNLASLLKKADQGDARSYAEVLDLMGLDAADKAEKLTQYEQLWEMHRTGGPVQDDEGDDQVPTNGQKQKLSLDDLPEELKAVIGRVMEIDKDYTANKHKTVREKVFNEVFQDLSQDKELGRLLTKGGPRAERLKREAQAKITGRIRDGAEYGPKLREEVITDLKELVKELGTGSGESTPLPGLGIAPGISHTEAQADTPPEPKQTTDPGYEQNVLKRILHHVINGPEGPA